MNLFGLKMNPLKNLLDDLKAANRGMDAQVHIAMKQALADAQQTMQQDGLTTVTANVFGQALGGGLAGGLQGLVQSNVGGFTMGGQGIAYGSQLAVTGPRIRHTLPEEHIVAAVVGWRVWNAPLFVDELRSFNGTPWPKYARLEAHCGPSVCTGVRCGCGIYAWKKREACQDVSSDPHYVVGEVWLWGRILECDLGFRAQFSYPKTFVDTGSRAQRLAEVYGVKLCPK